MTRELCNLWTHFVRKSCSITLTPYANIAAIMCHVSLSFLEANVFQWIFHGARKIFRAKNCSTIKKRCRWALFKKINVVNGVGQWQILLIMKPRGKQTTVVKIIDFLFLPILCKHTHFFAINKNHLHILWLQIDSSYENYTNLQIKR